MKSKFLNPPRTFKVGIHSTIDLKDMGQIDLAPNEQVTFTNEDTKSQYDVAKKHWGYYATPSMNGRLLDFGLKSVLIRNPQSGRYFILLVEKTKLDIFDKYLVDEKLDIVSWLDHEKNYLGFSKNTDIPVPACICGNQNQFKLIFDYHKAPEREVAFKFEGSQAYHREVYKCVFCGHFQSVHKMKVDIKYTEEYVNVNYGNLEGIKKKYESIMETDPKNSDNFGRVEVVSEFAKSYFMSSDFASKTVLDVGAGLGVFVGRMKAKGFKCTALDPDERTAKHARENIKVSAIQGDFFKTESSEKFDIVTLNKVIEHVEKPVEMLRRVHHFLKPNGFAYVEVPDGEIAQKDGDSREEFFIDHPHVFSMSSLTLATMQAGFKIIRLERLQEPSTKYTLRAFLTAE